MIWTWKEWKAVRRFSLSARDEKAKVKKRALGMCVDDVRRRVRQVLKYKCLKVRGFEEGYKVWTKEKSEEVKENEMGMR